MRNVDRLPSFNYMLLALAAIGNAVGLGWQIGPLPTAKSLSHSQPMRRLPGYRFTTMESAWPAISIYPGWPRRD